MDEVDHFINEPTIERLELLRKSQLMEIGNRLEFSVSKSMRKNELQRKIIEHMVDKDIFGEDTLIDVPDDTAKMTEAHIELEKARLQAKVEIARLEQEVE